MSAIQRFRIDFNDLKSKFSLNVRTHINLVISLADLRPVERIDVWEFFSLVSFLFPCSGKRKLIMLESGIVLTGEIKKKLDSY